MLHSGHLPAPCLLTLPSNGLRTHPLRQRARQQRAYFVAAGAAASPSTQAFDVPRAAQLLRDWAGKAPGLAKRKLEPRRLVNESGDILGCTASSDIKPGEVVLTVPEDLAITSVDAEKHEVVGQVAAQSSELVGLTLWLLAERAKGADSKWAVLLQALPASTLTPLLWTEEEVRELLRGSPMRDEALARTASLRQEWEALQEQHLTPDPARFPTTTYNEAAFMAAFSVVLAHAVYLPTAQCFALLPLASTMGRTGNDNGCTLDYDAEQQAVVVVAGKAIKEGQEVLLSDGRPNGELVLSTGSMQEANTSDFLLFRAVLIKADRYFSLKSEVLAGSGLAAEDMFPVFADRFPNQLLAFVRLARLQDPALFAKVSFDRDVELSQMNEYETLQLLMGDCRERLAAYKNSLEEDIKALQLPDVTPRERLALRLTRSEKKILSRTMDALRQRLAPIRGIPTKGGGMVDPNADIKEVFDLIEELPKVPGQLVGAFMQWARGEDDPTWGDKGAGKGGKGGPRKK